MTDNYEEKMEALAQSAMWTDEARSLFDEGTVDHVALGKCEEMIHAVMEGVEIGHEAWLQGMGLPDRRMPE